MGKIWGKSETAVCVFTCVCVVLVVVLRKYPAARWSLIAAQSVMSVFFVWLYASIATQPKMKTPVMNPYVDIEEKRSQQQKEKKKLEKERKTNGRPKFCLGSSSYPEKRYTVDDFLHNFNQSKVVSEIDEYDKTTESILVAMWHSFPHARIYWVMNDGTTELCVTDYHAVMRFNTEEAERGHTYIQMLFPLTKRSEIQQDTPYIDNRNPILSKNGNTTFENIQEHMVEALKKFRSTWWVDSTSHTSNFIQENHNWPRLSRMIESASIFYSKKVDGEIKELIVFVKQLLAKHKTVVSKSVVEWNKYISNHWMDLKFDDPQQHE